MLPEKDLLAALGHVASRAAHGPYSRCVAYHHLVSPSVPTVAAAQPLWSLGSKKFGGRFTPQNSFETVYLAEDPTTASAEVGLVFQHAHAPVVVRTHPWVVVTVDGNLVSVLDLTDARIVAVLGTTHQELTGEWRYTQSQTGTAPTQLLGRLCHDSGRFDGIRYPSSKNLPEGVCLAVFPDRLKDAAFLAVYDPFGNLAQRLP